MVKLAISKKTEATIISTMCHMGAESLCSNDQIELERIICVICNARKIYNTNVIPNKGERHE